MINVYAKALNFNGTISTAEGSHYNSVKCCAMDLGTSDDVIYQHLDQASTYRGLVLTTNPNDTREDYDLLLTEVFGMYDLAGNLITEYKNPIIGFTADEVVDILEARSSQLNETYIMHQLKNLGDITVLLGDSVYVKRAKPFSVKLTINVNYNFKRCYGHIFDNNHGFTLNQTLNVGKDEFDDEGNRCSACKILKK